VHPKDEGACYQWAVSNTGSDPFEVQKQESAAQQVAAQTQQAVQAVEGRIASFKKAFSACLEGKKYTVKY
jgi:hypothetical protein